MEGQNQIQAQPIQIVFGPRLVALSDGSTLSVVRLPRTVIEKMTVRALKEGEEGSQSRANQYLVRCAVVGGSDLKSGKDGSRVEVKVDLRSPLGEPACGAEVYDAIPTMGDVAAVLKVAAEAMTLELAKN